MTSSLVEVSPSKYKILNPDTVEAVRVTLTSDVVTRDDLVDLAETISSYPTILNVLTLSEVTRINELGIDLSGCITEIQLNNMRVFMFKYASDSMKRASKLIDYLTKLEDKIYTRYTESGYVDPAVALSMISSIQSSIGKTIDLLSKLTSNDTLMNLVFNLEQVNNTVTQNLTIESSKDSRDILPQESRVKVCNIFEKVLEELDSPEVIVQETVES